MNESRTYGHPNAAGFSLIELLVGTVVGSIIVAGSLVLLVTFLRFYNTTTLMRSTANAASLAIERMVIGVGTNSGLREANASTVTFTNMSNGWLLTYNTNLFYRYVSTTKVITNDTGMLICTNVAAASITCFTYSYSTNVVITNACRISISVAQNAGGDTWTNTFITQVQFRN